MGRQKLPQFHHRPLRVEKRQWSSTECVEESAAQRKANKPSHQHAEHPPERLCCPQARPPAAPLVPSMHALVAPPEAEKPEAETGAATPLLFGNVKAWKSVRAWFKDRSAGVGSMMLLLRGPSGVGKTSGVHLHAKRFQRGVVEVNVCDVIASRLDQTIREGCTRAAITASGETSDAGAGLVLIDDLEAYPAESLKILTDTLRHIGRVTGIVCTCSTGFRIPPLWKDQNECTTVNLSPLSIQDLCQVARCDRYFSKWASPSLMRLVATADGDARRAKNIMEMHKLRHRVGEEPNVQARGPERAPDNVFDAVKKLLFGRIIPDLNRVEHIASNYDTKFTQDLVFTNYIDAMGSGGLDLLSDAADLMSVGDCMRQGPVFAQLNEARILQWSVGTLNATRRQMPAVLRCPQKHAPNVDLKSSYLGERHGPVF